MYFFSLFISKIEYIKQQKWKIMQEVNPIAIA